MKRDQDVRVSDAKPRRFATIRDLTAGGSAEIGDTLERLGELLRPAKFRAVLQLRLLHAADTAETEIFKLTLAAGKPKVSRDAVKKPHVELVTRPETWKQIATGQLSPIEAFLTGKMRVRGDTGLAQRMMKHIAEPPGRTHLCLKEG